MTEQIIEHKCEEIPKRLMVYYYDSKKREKKIWYIYDEDYDSYIMIGYCPFCGMELEK